MTRLLIPRVGLAQTGAPLTGAECLDNFMGFTDETASLVRTCPAEATQSGSVWGTGVCSGDNSICRAALHAGRALTVGPFLRQG